MHRIILGVLAIGLFLTVRAQQPYRWAFTAKKTADKTYAIHLTAAIDNGWHTYSQTTPDGGPLPTKITFGKNPLVTRVGNVEELGKMEKYHEAVFDVDVKRYSDKVDFVQVVKLKAAVKTRLNGTVEFMVCNDHECLPPKTLPFSIAIN